MSVDTLRNTKPPHVLRVWLYGAISSAQENLPVNTSPAGRAKSLVARGIDVTSWFALKKSGFHFHHWRTLQNSNKGDSAVREAITAQIRKAFAPREIEFHELQWGQLNEHSLAELSRHCDLFVIGGSGYIRVQYDGTLPNAMIDDMGALAKLSCPKVAYGIGKNTLLGEDGVPRATLSDQGRQQLKSLLETIDLVSVRDRPTHELVHDVSGKPPMLAGDPALFYPDLFAPKQQDRSSKTLQVGLNLAAHGPAAAERLEKQIDNYAAFLKLLSTERKMTLHYIQHAETERVVPLMLSSRGISVVRHDPSADKLPDFYRGLDVHISQMMHSAILSLGSGTPTMNFGYDTKNFALFDVMNLSEFCISAWNFNQDTALASARKLIDRRAAIKTAVLERKKELKAELDGFLRAIADRLKPKSDVDDAQKLPANTGVKLGGQTFV